MYTASERKDICNLILKACGDFVWRPEADFVFNETKIGNNGSGIYKVRVRGNLNQSRYTTNNPNLSYFRILGTHIYFSSTEVINDKVEINFTVTGIEDRYFITLAKFCSQDIEKFKLTYKGEGSYTIESKRPLTFYDYDAMVNIDSRFRDVVITFKKEDEAVYTYNTALEPV